MKLDTAEYLPYLDKYDMTDEQKEAYLQELWNIMSHFVDMAWTDVGREQS